ncbi:MAG: hypothetical protein VYA34_03475 [Myxococcota bacterium]|nr:hypothetical protein [Myxococcota bacterium]
MTTETFELKKISHDGIEHALEKSRHYRLLNEPEQAESLCLDILEIEPNNQAALVIVVLALTDQFANDGASRTIRRANEYIAKLSNEYHKLYYAGIVYEREGRATLRRHMAHAEAYACFRDAMHCYEKANEIKPEHNDDAIQRWNSCARTIMKENLCAPKQEEESFLE